jgi:hypothetical protein
MPVYKKIWDEFGLILYWERTVLGWFDTMAQKKK